MCAYCIKQVTYSRFEKKQNSFLKISNRSFRLGGACRVLGKTLLFFVIMFLFSAKVFLIVMLTKYKLWSYVMITEFILWEYGFIFKLFRHHSALSGSPKGIWNKVSYTQLYICRNRRSRGFGNMYFMSIWSGCPLRKSIKPARVAYALRVT